MTKTFENFIVGTSNESAWSDSKNFALNTGVNLLCIRGSSGSGKTHLLHAIKTETERIQPDCKVACLTSENLKHMIYDYIMKNNNRYRNVFTDSNIILIDDIDLLRGWEATSEMICVQIGEAMRLNKKVAVTYGGTRPKRSKKPPCYIDMFLKDALNVIIKKTDKKTLWNCFCFYSGISKSDINRDTEMILYKCKSISETIGLANRFHAQHNLFCLQGKEKPDDT